MTIKTYAALAAVLSSATFIAVPQFASAEVFTTMPSQRPNSPQLCLDVDVAGAKLGIWGCHGQVNQNLTVNGGPMMLDGKCVDVAGQGAPVVMAACNGSSSQQWSKGGNSSIQNKAGMCLDIPNGNIAQGVKLLGWPCHGGVGQRFFTR